MRRAKSEAAEKGSWKSERSIVPMGGVYGNTREGGEPRPKGPTVGKATPGITLSWRALREKL